MISKEHYEAIFLRRFGIVFNDFVMKFSTLLCRPQHLSEFVFYIELWKKHAGGKTRYGNKCGAKLVSGI